MPVVSSGLSNVTSPYYNKQFVYNLVICCRLVKPSVKVRVVPAEDDLDKLCQEFPDYDRGLVGAILADQGGDVPEVHACLRVMLLCLVLPLQFLD